ncbi:MAG TPA: FAD-dependent monooxygenase [Acidobacteriaceae bacterium]|jgi:flavin-dependent dehydrogenase|nr:FAD-dependent monooxygenase [Acidobacteriaceae bacterium]
MTVTTRPAGGSSAGQEAGALDVLVLGGGLAGAAAAIELARGGWRAAVVDRADGAHDKVCGEFLSAEAIRDLAALGVDPEALGALPIAAVRLAGRLGVSEAPLPFAALSLTRRVLDDELLRTAADAGALVLRGRSVEGLHRQADAWSAEVAGPRGSTMLRARHILLATGKHDLRGLPRPAGSQNDLVAFKMYFRLEAEQAAALDRHVELVLFRGGYTGLQMMPDGAANLAALVRKSTLRQMGGGWEALLAAMQRDSPHLRARLAGAQQLLPKPLAASSIPYGMLRRQAVADGVWAVGDQAVVIPSFTGDGMSLALHSGRLAARMLLAGETAEAFQRALHDQVRRQLAFAMVISHAVLVQPQSMGVELSARVWPGVLRGIAAGTRLAARHHLSPTQEGHRVTR